MDFGHWKACNINQLRKDPAFQDYLYSPAKFDAAIKQGEHFLDVISCMPQALQDISQQQISGNVLVVSSAKVVITCDKKGILAIVTKTCLLIL